MNEIRIKSGMSTRVITLTTGERYSFSHTILDKAAEQAGRGFIPIGVEHLTYLPPSGYIARAEVVTDVDGESELIMYGEDLKLGRADDLVLATPASEPQDLVPVGENATMGTESRNFASETWQELQSEAPFPLKEKPTWSDLPPIILTLAIPVTWGAVKFAGSFFSQLGTATADGLVSWIKKAAHKAKDNGRETLVEISFNIDDYGPTILGFTAFNTQSETSTAELQQALDMAGRLAEFAGSVAAGHQPETLRRCAFQWDKNQWRLAWWATDERVYVTPWFSANYPEPQRFLGRPLLNPDTDDVGSLSPPDTTN